jgi:glycerophosphoryl diester phosphodiesterase
MHTYKPMVIAHRGAAGEAPENTLASFQLGLEQGAGGIELDVHLSKNGDIIVMHDETLDRTTDGTGSIIETETSDIKRLDAGSWFGEKYKGEKVPLLEEVFELVPRSILINVEIKNSYNGKMETKLAEFLRMHKRLENVVISSFNHKCLRRLKEQEPKAKVGLLYAANLDDHTGYAQQLGMDVYSLHPHFHLIDKEDVQKATLTGLHVYPYTVNKIEDYRTMIEFGVSGIITDYPARLVKLLEG